MVALKQRAFAIAGLAVAAVLVACSSGDKGPDQMVQALTGQVKQLQDQLAHVSQACAAQSQNILQTISQSSTLSPDSQRALVTAQLTQQQPNGNMSIDDCNAQISKYFLLAKSLNENDFNNQKNALDAANTQLQNAWASNTAYRKATVQMLMQTLYSAGGQAASPLQLLQFAQNFRGQIASYATGVGLTQDDLAPLLAQLDTLQNSAILQIAAGNQNGQGAAPANGGNLGINLGSGLGGRTSGSGGLSLGSAGTLSTGKISSSGLGYLGATSTGSMSTGQKVNYATSGGGSSGGGLTLNLGGGTGSRTATRAATVAQNEVVLMTDGANLKQKYGASWFESRRKIRTVTAH
jgi:hypothetical protein